MEQTYSDIYETGLTEVEKRALDIRIDVAARITALMDRHGHTQKQLALLANMPEQVLSRVINSATNWRSETIAKIEVALGEELLFVPEAVTSVGVSFLKQPAGGGMEYNWEQGNSIDLNTISKKWREQRKTGATVFAEPRSGEQIEVAA